MEPFQIAAMIMLGVYTFWKFIAMCICAFAGEGVQFLFNMIGLVYMVIALFVIGAIS
jgi:hypothetical protein